MRRFHLRPRANERRFRRYDNYNGHWGDPAQLNRFLQAYAVEKTKLESRKRGHTVTEHALQDGSVRLHIVEGS
jgi:hypothetical protein